MRDLVRAALAGCLALGATAVAPAVAGPIPLVAGNFVTEGGLSVTVDVCQIIMSPSIPASRGCLASDNLELVLSSNPGPPGNGPSITALIHRLGGDIFTATAGDGNTYDLGVELTVATVGGAAKINSAALAMTGSAVTPAEGLRIGVGEAVAADSTYPLNVNITGPTSAAVAFAPQSSIHVVKDIKLNSALRAGFTLGDSMILSSVTQVFGQVPEPATIGLMATGLVALGALRRRRNSGTSAR